jgi:flagellar hook protein FlgE
MAFQQGLSGLNAYSRALDVISNNVANASTVGFKESQAHFGDIYAGALNGVSSSNQVGIGVNLLAVQQLFTQGNVSTTNNPLDIAINGNGFYRLQVNPLDQTGYYTRNGQFHLDNEGYIVNSNGGYLTGYLSNDGVSVNYATIAPITVGAGSIPSAQTGWSTRLDASKGGLVLGANLDSRDQRAAMATDPDWQELQSFAWDSTFNTNMFNWSTSATVFDQTGASHTLTNYYVRQEDSGAASRTWEVYTVIDNKYLVSAGSTSPTAALEFNLDGTLDTSGTTRVPLDLSEVYDSTGAIVDLTQDTASYPATVAKPWFSQIGTPPYAFHLDMSQTTQFGLSFNQDSAIQDGYTAGSMTKMSVDDQGNVLVGYSNGQSRIMGQIVLAEFKNPNGLQSIGNNMWIETRDSGQPTLGEPGGGTRGLLQGGAVEDSNTDLTQELVNMIIMQRNYQANAQTIRTQDQIMQTLVNLR